jgi:hypothetical protein
VEIQTAQRGSMHAVIIMMLFPIAAGCRGWEAIGRRILVSGNGISSQDGGDEDGELGEHHIAGVVFEGFLCMS